MTPHDRPPRDRRPGTGQPQGRLLRHPVVAVPDQGRADLRLPADQHPAGDLVRTARDRADAAASRPQPHRPVRAPADPRRRHEVDAQGGRHPGRGRQGDLHARAAARRDDGLRLVRDHPARRPGLDVRPHDAAAADRLPRRRSARPRRGVRGRLRHHPRRLVLGLDLPAPRWPALDRAGDLLRDRHGPRPGRGVHLQRLDVDVADRLRASRRSGTSRPGSSRSRSTS